MFNNVRRCLITSVRTRGKFLVRSIHENVLSPELHSRVNARSPNNAAYKRFYCQATSNEQNLKSADLRNEQQRLDRQELDEFLSDPENKKRFQILELELDVLRHNAERVPDNIEPRDWLLLLTATTKSKRRKYLEFLWRNEKTQENEKAKKELKKAEWLAKKEELLAADDNGEMKYGLLHNTLFMRIYETTINRYYNGKLIQGMMFEPKLVFDCGYDNHMNERETHNCAKQLSLAFARNRGHVDPMCLYFCNFNKDGLLKRHLHQNIPTLLNDDFPVIITPQSYLDIFPKNQLVYLTPHCRVNLQEYDPDTVYIIGALVDKCDSQPLSLAKAKREGIRMARFPLDTYLDWGASSSKNLTLDQSIRIMLDLRHTRDWNKALKNVPTRKLRTARENSLRNKLNKSIFSDTSEIKEPSSVPKDFTFEKFQMALYRQSTTTPVIS